MPIYKIRGIDVDFPYEAYDCQIVYMEKVIQSLQEGCNALLESPTGTGKTLCLLCATLAWRKSLGDFSSNLSEANSNYGSQNECSSFPPIIYTSRTHSQLKQVIRELKLSNYRPRMTVLGSREQFCIHPDLQSIQGRARDMACNYLCKKRSCGHYTRVSEFMKRHPTLGNEPFDIEDLVNIGKTKGPCPYYISRELHKVVDIIFAPYNYLVDSKRRGFLSDFAWKDTVLIFDEAHNLEGICADAASFDFPSSYLTASISEAEQCIEFANKRRSIQKSSEKVYDPDQYAILRALMLKLEKKISEISIESKELGFTRPGSYIYEFLSDLKITVETSKMLISTVDDAIFLLEEENAINNKKGNICRLEGFKDILEIIFRDGGMTHGKFYRFHVQESQLKVAGFSKGSTSRTLSWWCFNPGIAMEKFEKLGVRSIILTSGTLSPLDSFAVELNLKFPVMLENPHVVSSNQVWVGVVPTGPSGGMLNSSFRNRDSLEYKQELGNAIVNFARVVPDGLLVFFPSYYLMDQCIECWKSMSHVSATNQSTTWERICKHKQPVVEPRQSAQFAEAIEDFEVKLQESPSGAIFFAVCRGKVSEGLDFADHAGRAVLVTGMPFAMRTDPKVQLKRDYLNQQAFSKLKDSKALNGEEWYVQQAARAVNQAVGRVIRHRHDYGAIIFCDERFTRQNHQNQMSYWIRPYVKCYSVFGDVIYKLTRFFRDQKNSCQLNLKKAGFFNKGSSNVDIDYTPEQSPPAENSSPLDVAVVEGFPKKPIPALSLTTCVDSDELSEIVPANRANVSNLEVKSTTLNPTLTSIFLKKRSATDVKRKRPQSGNVQSIDLTRDTEEPHDRGNDRAVLHCAADASKLHKTDEEKDGLLKHTLGGQPMLFAKVDSDAPLTVSKMDATIHQNTLHASSCEPEVIRGSAFLQEVKEKLTATEYEEFIGFMVALKSKTMKIAPMLESVARLFSVPGRIGLLKSFRDYIPAKYQALYDYYLNAGAAAVDNKCAKTFSMDGTDLQRARV